MDGKPTIVSCSNKLTIQEGGMGVQNRFTENKTRDGYKIIILCN